jgi:hypothetical protein
MKVIIAGSHKGISPWLGHQLIRSAVHVAKSLKWDITEVVSGTAQCIDTYGEMWAKANDIPVRQFPADWDKYGKRAGYLRNEQMAEYGDGLIAITNGSPGTANMVSIARAKKIPVIVIEFPC